MSKKIYAAIMVLTLLIAGAAAAFGIQRNAREAAAFWGDGYVLSYQTGENGAVIPEPVYFTAGTRYKTAYDGNITFKDMYGKKQEVSGDAFIHYADESVSTFHSGVVMEMNDLSRGILNYYSLGEDSIMNRQGEGYLLDNQGTPLEFQDYIWKIQEDKYLIVSPELELTLPDSSKETLSGYLELEYIDKGIARLSDAERAFQILTMGSSVRLSDGSVLHLEDRSVEKDGQVNLYLSEILLDEIAGANIPVVPSEAKPAKVPTFDITTIDGEEGEAGQTGETGETGEKGEEGKAGDAGEAGEDGEEGEEGDEGDEGRDGDEGAKGDSGEKGQSGEAGSAGATGGTGGSGGAGSNADKVVMPVYVLSEFSYDITQVSGIIDVDNAEDVNGVEMTGGTLSILDTSNNQVIETVPYDADQLSAFSRLDFSVPRLNPDNKYKLMFKASYRLTESEAGADAEGERTFLTRTFTTTSFGILEQYRYATENSMAVTLEKLDYAGNDTVRVVLLDKEGQQAASPVTVNAADWTSSGKTKTYVAEFTDLESNTAYTVLTEVMDPVTGVYVEVSQSEYRTLKKTPQVLKAPVVANNPKGYFEIRPELGTDADPGIVDPDRAITAYRYDIYTYVGGAAGTLKASVYGEGTSVTAIYVDNIQIERDVDYVARLVIEYYDNEKTVDVESPQTDPFYMEEYTGVPYLVFKENKVEGGVQYDKIFGTMTVELNGAALDIDSTKPLTLMVYHEKFGEKDYHLWDKQPDNLGTLTVPVRLTGLSENTTYRFTLHGYYKGTDAQQILATTIVKTPPANSLRAVMKETSVMGDSVHPLNAEIWFEYGDQASKLQGGQYEAQKIQYIRLSLSQGGQRYEKDIACTITPTKTSVDNPDFPEAPKLEYTDYTSDFPQLYFNLNQADEPVGKLNVTNATFELADDTITGSNYILRVEYLNDYTATDQYRYQSDFTQPNQIQVTNNELELKPVETMPDLPKDPIEVTEILRSAAESWGIPLTQEMKDLPPDTVVGFALKPNYDNSSYYAENYTMYAYEKKFYEANIETVESELLPLQALKEQEPGMENLFWKKEKEGTEWSSTLPGMIFMMGDGTPGTVTSRDSSFYGYSYRFFPEMVRGQRYVFAYDVNLDMSSGTYTYPYDSTAYKLLDFPEGILRSEKGDMARPDQVGAARAIPVLKLYPETVKEGEVSWKMSVKDPDGALFDESFQVSYGGLVTPVKAVYTPPASQQPEENPAYGEVTAALSELVGAGEVEEMLVLSAVYHLYYDGLDPQDRKEEELLYQPYYQYTAPELTGITQDIDAGNKANALIFNLNITGTNLPKKVAGVRIDLIPDAGESGVSKKTLYAPVSYQAGGSYQVKISKDEVSDFFGKKFQVSCRLLYPEKEYGYGVTYGGADKFLGIVMTNLGRYISYDPEDNKNPLTEAETVYNSMLRLEKPEISGDRATLSLESAYGNKFYRSFSADFTSEGVVTSSLLNRKTVLFQIGLEEGTPQSVKGTFDQIIPVVSNPRADAALEEATFTFKLTDKVDTLLQNPPAITFVLGYTETDEQGTTTTKEDKYVVSYDDLTKTGENQYQYTFKNLKKKTTYKVVLKADLVGADTDSRKKNVQFLNTEGDPFEFIFTTLGEIKVINPTAQMVNRYYNYKVANLTYGLDSIVGIKLRYDLYDVTGKKDLDALLLEKPAISYEQLSAYGAGETYKPYDANKKRFYETGQENLKTSGNFLRLDLSGPISQEDPSLPLKKGHEYRWRISVYPKDTDYSQPGYEGKMAGSGWSNAFQYPQMNPPMSQINIRPVSPENLDAETRELIVQPILGETPGDANGSVVATNAFVMLHPDTGLPLKAGSTVDKPQAAGAQDGYWLVNRTGQTLSSQEKARGAYVLQLLEAKYSENWNPNDGTVVEAEGWELVNINSYCSDPAIGAQLTQDAIHGIVNIPLAGLKANWEYKVRLYAVLDPELTGKEEIQVPAPGEDLINRPDVTLLTEVTQRTVGKNGILIDAERVDVEQLDANTVGINIYDAVGLERVKTIMGTFYPRGIEGVTDPVPLPRLQITDEMKTTRTLSDGTTITTIKVPAAFRAAGTYRAVIALYGDDITQDPLLDHTYVLKVTSVAARISSRLPVCRLAALLPEKKENVGKEKAHA